MTFGTPAVPCLASTLYTNILERINSQPSPPRTGSGCRDLDEALNGGLAYGMGMGSGAEKSSVISLASETGGEEGREVS
jgi:hypothetical protein